MKKTVKNRMWRTLVRVVEKRNMAQYGEYFAGIMLIVPAFSATEQVWCPYKAIPPDIFRIMRRGTRWHVNCNIGVERQSLMCFDRWETSEEHKEPLKAIYQRE